MQLDELVARKFAVRSGRGVVMQFDLTGIDEIASGCGLAVYEKK